MNGFYSKNECLKPISRTIIIDTFRSQKLDNRITIEFHCSKYVINTCTGERDNESQVVLLFILAFGQAAMGN